MSSTAFSLVLIAALLHAGWNAMVKATGDRAVVLAAVSCVHALFGLVLVLFADPPAPASWPSIFASTVIHYGYYILLFQAYRLGDLSQVYPISRGLAPAIVALGALVFLGENLTPLGWIGLGAVSVGIGFLAWQRGAPQASRRAVAVAVILGLCIASYSFADGVGIRLSQSPLGYMGWLFLFEFPVPFFVALSRMRARKRIDLGTIGVGLFGGVFAVTAYGLALYAKSIAPLGAVSAVRESSVIFAALIGLFLFGERPIMGRIVSAAMVAAGVIALARAG
ncbi:EamA family transporter [Nitratireductor sp. GISD-1A_MAKvit]|uniref:EamA family transporter n=1 Tax=Nitratireductor sp. GISD-1A_MAKvit TaxID=3234198 RepID=UPI003467B45B